MKSFAAHLVSINKRHNSDCALWGVLATLEGTFRACVPRGHGCYHWKTLKQRFSTAEEASAAAKEAWRTKFWRSRKSRAGSAGSVAKTVTWRGGD